MIRIHAGFTKLDSWVCNSDELKHLHVLRIKDKEPLEILNFLGERVCASWIDKNIKFLSEIETVSSKMSPLKIAVGVPAREAQEDIARWAGVLGISKIIFVKTKNSGPHRINTERLTKLVAEGQKQSGACFRWEGFEERNTLTATEDFLALDPSGEPIGHVVDQKTPLNFFIGPPGGFHGEELSGMRLVSLGGPILRSEDVLPWLHGFLTSRLKCENMNERYGGSRRSDNN